MIGYLCAYLRYYYPIEFVTAYLNNAANEEDIAGGTELADTYRIKVAPPRFGHSLANYTMDKEANTISKGIASVKGLNATVPEQLFNLAHKHRWEHFSDLLIGIADETSLRRDQLDTLIEIDFFNGYGNIPTLIRVRDMVEKFKYGKAKRVKKSQVAELAGFIEPWASGVTAAGKESESYTLLDAHQILRAVEGHIITRDITDWDYAQKAKAQKKHLGYVDLTTGRKEDKGRVVVITKPITIVSKKKGEPWCVSFDVKSIGTGKALRVSVKPGLFTAYPLEEGDIIEIPPHGMTLNKNGYWWINFYSYYE